MSTRDRARELRTHLRRMQPATDGLRRRFAIVTPLGWATAVISLGFWLLSALLHWVEFALVATCGIALLVLSALMTLGRTLIRVEVDVRPRRVVEGGTAGGHVHVTNVSKVRLFSILLELPIGAAAGRFALPSLPSGGEHEELFVVPTQHRGVIPVGPATTVRGDPFGLLRKAVTWTDVTELFIHPTVVPLPSLGSGFLRDLEGQQTNDISMSDLAFNALREFVPGDDRRFVHWRSTAKASSANPSAPLLVRQFLDTRRSQVFVLVDGNAANYADSDDFETALRIGASVAVRAITDQMETAVLAGGHYADRKPAHLTLDTFSRAQPVSDSLIEQAIRAARTSPDTSLAVIVTGSAPSYEDLRTAAARFSLDARKLMLRVDPNADLRLFAHGNETVLTIPTLTDLPKALSQVPVS